MSSGSKPRVKNPETMARCYKALVARGVKKHEAKRRVEAMSRQRMWVILWDAQARKK